MSRISRTRCMYVYMCCLGWAKSKDVEQLSMSQRGPFLTALFKALKLERPLLISASMSGSYVVPYIMSPEPQSCRERVSAFVPLAPAGTERFTHVQYHRCEVGQIKCALVCFFKS